MKEFEIFKNGTQQGTVKARNLKEAKKEVFATYGEHREVYERDLKEAFKAYCEDNVIKVEGGYIEQTTQYNRLFTTKKELFTYFKKEFIL